MVPFAGYYMPVQYSEGIKSEYQTIRNNVGMFDVSHMGEIEISGKNAELFLQKLTINDVTQLYNGKAQYSAMCRENGGIIDDLILYKFENKYIMVVNASNLEKNWNWLNNNLISEVNLKNLSNVTSLIAIQGPKSRNILSELFPEIIDLKFYHAIEITYNNEKLMISRTGYTGELGYEIYGSGDSIKSIWKRLLEKDVKPCGLGVRDVLRMEMKCCLYGNDIDESTHPLEAGLGWITNLNADFIGRDNLLIIKQDRLNRKLVAIKLNERGIPRKGYKITKNKKLIGEICSGTQSIGLNSGIGIGYVENGFHKIGTEISVLIRDKEVNATIIKPPFIKKTSLLD